MKKINELPVATAAASTDKFVIETSSGTKQVSKENVDKNLVKIQSTQPTEADNRIWVNTSSSGTIELATEDEVAELKNDITQASLRIPILLESGKYNSNSNSKVSDSSRIRSINLLPRNYYISITIPADYDMCVQGFTSNGTFEELTNWYNNINVAVDKILTHNDSMFFTVIFRDHADPTSDISANVNALQSSLVVSTSDNILRSALYAENRLENRLVFDVYSSFSDRISGKSINVDVHHGVINISDANYGASLYLELKNPLSKINNAASATKYLTLLAGHTYRLRTIPVSGSFSGISDNIMCTICSGKSSADYSVKVDGDEVLFSYISNTTVSLVLYIKYGTVGNVVFQYALEDVSDVAEREAQLNNVDNVIYAENKANNKLAFDVNGTFEINKVDVQVKNGIINAKVDNYGRSLLLELKNPLNNINSWDSATKNITCLAGHVYRLRTVPISGTFPEDGSICGCRIASGQSSPDYGVTANGEEITFSYNEDTTVSLVFYVKYENTVDVVFQYNLEDISEADGIPTYYNQQIFNVANNYREDIEKVGRNGDSFVFITDIHWEGNWRHSPALINYLVKNEDLNMIICGGDVIDGSNDSANFERSAKFLRGVIDEFRKTGALVITAKGNHDLNHYKPSWSSDGTFSEQKYFGLAQKPSTMNGQIYGGDCYFYYDKVSTKTRYIVLDSKTNTDPTFDITTDQLTWIDGIIDNTPTNYHIIVVVHILGTYQSQSDPVEAGVNDFVFKNGATSLKTLLDNKLSSHMIEAVFFGHTHYDDVLYTTGGIPLISTNSDGKWQYYGMTQPSDGTVNAQCFDVITIDYTPDNNNKKHIYMRRVGRGSDRTVAY